MMLLVTIGPVSANHIDEIVAEAPIGVRLTLSFGAPDLQLARAREIQRAAKIQAQEIPIWISLSGATDRVGRIYRGDYEAEFSIAEGEAFQIIDAAAVDLGKVEALPIPQFGFKRAKTGDKIIYGDNQCEFVIEHADESGAVARARTAVAVVGTRSIYFRNEPVRNSIFDRPLDELHWVFKNGSLFSGLIVPDVTHPAMVDQVMGLSHEYELRLELISSVERDLPATDLKEILRRSQYVLIDRAKIALNEGPERMPQIVWKFLQRLDIDPTRILIASNVATSVSLGQGSVLSSSELSDLWHLVQSGIGGVVLTEETAVNPNFLRAIRGTRDFIDLQHG